MPASSLNLLNRQLLDSLSLKAAASPRQRQNHNFHQLDERVQRMLNAMQPGTYVRPHRHLREPDTNGFEFFLALQGEIGILIFDETGTILDRRRINAQGPTYGIELPEATYHALVSLAPNSIIFELKEGPYNPSTDKEFLPMFPLEGTDTAQHLVAAWQQEFEVLDS